MLTLLDWIAFHIDDAVEMLMQGKSRDECACFLLNFKKELLKGKDETIVDEEKMKYIESEDMNE